MESIENICEIIFIVIIIAIFLTITVYGALLIFYRGKKVRITVTDKWTSKHKGYSQYKGEYTYEHCLIKCRYQDSERVRTVDCTGSVYNLLKVNKTYTVTIKLFHIEKIHRNITGVKKGKMKISGDAAVIDFPEKPSAIKNIIKHIFIFLVITVIHIGAFSVILAVFVSDRLNILSSEFELSQLIIFIVIMLAVECAAFFAARLIYENVWGKIRIAYLIYNLLMALAVAACFIVFWYSYISDISIK